MLSRMTVRLPAVVAMPAVVPVVVAAAHPHRFATQPLRLLRQLRRPLQLRPLLRQWQHPLQLLR